MHPILFHLPFGSVISSYGFFMTVAAIVGFFGTLFVASHRGFPIRQVGITLAVMLVAAFVGGRLLNILVNRQAFLTHPERILALDTSGFSLYGGIMFATLAGWIFLRYFHLDSWKFADTATPVLGISISLMRIGCFLNGCCFGHETALPWGVSFPVMSQAHRYQLATHPGDFFSVTPVHPTELYELLAALTLSGLAIFLLRRKAPTGIPFLSFVVLFSLFRLGNSFLRVAPPSFDAPIFLYPALYLFFAALGMALIVRRSRSSR
jgi:phosphatidylglycerol---prolipoprotein diacylglyceryl transferase